MPRNRVPKPEGWKGGSDDFTVLSEGFGGHLGIDRDEEYSLDDLRKRTNAKQALDSWDDYDPQC